MIFDLELKKVGKVFDNGTTAVSEFDLSVSKGEFIAFLGPSGCGKTTTLRMIAGFESISSGDMMIKGVRMNDVPPEHRPTSMIFQSYALFPHMTVRRNVGYGLEVKGLSDADRNAKVDRILATLGLEDIADRKPDKLSGGQRQRIALARGLVVEPDILLLDEPLGALDANLRKAIQNELKLLQKNLGVTFIFVTHAQSEALALSDRIVVMNQGRVEQISPPHQLYTRPNTPFVAQFIGRNTIFTGEMQKSEGDTAVVKTAAGVLSGRVNGSISDRGKVNVVVPAEAIEVHGAAGVERARIAGEFGGNVIDAMITRCDVVGHLSQLTAALPDGRAISLEAHVDKYRPDTFAVGSGVLLSWKPAEATVIPAH
ncbi:ABC transporter ATP-binding protein [Rhizobium sp. KVB221]|uniref:ABC transporter ATP-binding protein n=1 Tax=Rhizobium setariae TaxID=2801340 RepID=A0A937CNY5_9HYPH|nr:ABC transporter ATP-binding protein [Rhizobium setariae]MBL0372549.1 ABC transporter ATP-binding protein [Rhizobium setariae]